MARSVWNAQGEEIRALFAAAYFGAEDEDVDMKQVGMIEEKYSKSKT
jgi:hypothetical protein